MTAPTSDRAQRQRLADALRDSVCITNGNALRVASAVADYITERLGGGEREHATAETDARIDGWNKVCNALASAYPQMHDELQHIKVHARPAHAIRTLAQTAKDATARAERAENERAELKMRNNNLHEENINVHKLATDLRAQLDAMTGEQVPYMVHVNALGQQIQLYRHPSPAARVVEWDRIAHFAPDGKYIGTVAKDDQESVFSLFRKCPERAVFRRMYVGEVVGPALTPNADGQTARVDEVSDTANGLRHVARGPNSPQGAVAYGRTAKDATQLLDTIRQHKSTPNADGAK